MIAKKNRTWLQLSALVLLSSLTIMCQSAGEKKENEYYDSQFNQYVYGTSCRQIWPSVKTYFAKEKFFLPDPAAGEKSFIVDSEWRDDSFGSSRVKKSASIQARDVEGRGCSLEATIKTEDTSGPNTQRFKERYTYAERKLIESIEPKRYQKVIQEGTRIRTEVDGPK